MAIKDWSSKFSVGSDYDGNIAGSMPQLAQFVDKTRVSQAHALREAMAAVQKQVFGPPWFEWNGTDITQFDSPIIGSNLAGGSAVSYIADFSSSGLSFIEFSAAKTSGPALGFLDNSIVLPIVAPPPTTNYLIIAEAVMTEEGTGTGKFGAGVGVRFDGAGGMYHHTAFKNDGSDPSAAGFKMVTGTSTPLQGEHLSVDKWSPGKGAVLACGVIGDAFLRWGGREFSNTVLDISIPITAKGKAVLMAGPAEESTTSTMKFLYRNIRCYTLL